MYFSSSQERNIWVLGGVFVIVRTDWGQWREFFFLKKKTWFCVEFLKGVGLRIIIIITVRGMEW